MTKYIVVHDLISLNFFIDKNIKKEIDIKDDIFVCSINPEKTDVYNQDKIKVINLYDKNSIFCKFNYKLRQLTSILRLLEENLIKNEMFVQNCTCVFSDINNLNEFKDKYDILTSNYNVKKHEIDSFNRYKKWIENIFSMKDLVIENTGMAFFYTNLKKKDDILKYSTFFVEKVYNEFLKNPKVYWYSDFFSNAYLNYLNFYGITYKSVWPKFQYFTEKIIHYYKDGS